MSEFSPAPWNVNLVDNTLIIDCDGNIVATTFQDDDDYSINYVCREADARLSAAAPELLAALKALFASYKELADSGDAGFWKLEDCPEGEQALAAIAKAEGGAS